MRTIHHAFSRLSCTTRKSHLTSMGPFFWSAFNQVMVPLASKPIKTAASRKSLPADPDAWPLLQRTGHRASWQHGLASPGNGWPAASQACQSILHPCCSFSVMLRAPWFAGPNFVTTCTNWDQSVGFRQQISFERMAWWPLVAICRPIGCCSHTSGASSHGPHPKTLCLWWCPDPRAALRPKDIKVSKSMRAVLRKGNVHHHIRHQL